MLGDDKISFDEIADQTLQVKIYDENDLYLMNEKNSSTCYILFNCTTYSGFCLDWREIGDGLVHCTNGEDEKHFTDMELSECNLITEYRCQNGLCIPRSFLLDRIFDCPEWYDEHKNYEIYTEEFSNKCSTNPSIAECEEHRLGLNFFPCGDGQHIGVHTNHKHSCWNLRNALLIKTLFRPYFHQIRHDLCNLKMLCVFNVLCLFEYCPEGLAKLCEELLSSYPNKSCSEIFVFPPGPFVFSYVRLVYNSSKPRKTIYPDWLCWNRSRFDTPVNYSRHEVNGFDCIETKNLLLESQYGPYNYTLFTSTRLILIIQRLFSGYMHRKAHERLYNCSSSQLTISVHRIMDENNDCFPWRILQEEEGFNNENQNIACRSPDRFHCMSEKKCIPRIFVGDTFRQCLGGEDESFFIQCKDDFSCTYLREMDLAQRQGILYQEICDTNDAFKWNILIRESNDTDETDCEMWPCSTPYIRCNGRWDRPNGCDEINCPHSSKTSCAEDEHPCASLNSTIMGCLPLAKASDGHFDCLFGTDEFLTLGFWLRSSINAETKAIQSHRHYRLPCWNQSRTTVEHYQVCNGINECPLGDDEFFCNWHQHSTCHKSTEFTCKDGTCISRARQWCNGVIDCAPDGEDERFCYVLKPQFVSAHNIRKQPNVPFSFDRFISPERRLRRSLSPTTHCHRGIVIYNELNKINECLCPPSYYGSYCQWQSERLTISYRVNVPPLFDRYAMYWIVFYLLDEYDQVLTYETMIHTVFNKYWASKQLIYLNYPRSTEARFLFNEKFVRINVYRVTNISIELTPFSWYYMVQFSSFIPVTRLAISLVLQEPTKNQTNNCQKFGPCEHGGCEIFLNTNNPFCRCDDGWLGRLCNKNRSTDLCETLNCSHRFGKCIVYNNHAFCLCTLGRIGPKCEISFNPCSSIRCRNNGICVSLDPRTISHVCTCPTPYFGNLCEYTSAQLKINLPANISSNVIPMLIIHFLEPPKNIPGTLIHRDYMFYRNVHPKTELIVHETNQRFLSPIIVVQFYFNSTSLHGSYYLLTLSNTNSSQLTTQIREAYHCQHANEHLNSSLANESWLKRIKFYPLYMKHIKCFYDEAYMCFVDKNGFPDCLLYNHNVTKCTSQNMCVNDGQCLQSKKLGLYEFACICPQCTAGEFCQIQLTEFSITLDSVLAQITLTDVSLNDQPIAVKILLLVISLMLIIGFISNILSFLVFRHKDIRQIGCGYYLIALAIMNQVTIIIFVARVIFLIISQIMIITNGRFLNISCRLFDFILQVCITFCDWLNICIACERTVSAVKGALFNKRRSVRLVRIILPILSVQTILTSVHQIFNHHLTEDPRVDSRTWCVIKYPQPWLRIYDICINIFNNIIPLLINFICGIILLITLTINQKRIKKKEPYRTIFFSQITQHKDLLIVPTTIILAKLPLLIVSLSIKCMKEQWHIYLSLFAYCFSLIPLISTFLNFIWPSDSYMKKFRKQFPCFK